jgi:hypothetical protein
MIHTKIISEELHKTISKLTKLTWIDVSYGNDECDSIENEELDVMIFLPNFTEYTTFNIIKASEYGACEDTKEFVNLVEMVKYINELKQ